MKYILNGINLKEFCNINGIDYKVTLSRISKIKKKFKDIEINDMLRIALNNELYKKYFKPYRKYYYNEIALADYCKKYDLDYNVIIRRIRSLKKRYPQFIEERIISIAINNDLYDKMKDQNTVLKYFYKDDTLYSYCEKNNLEYTKIVLRIKGLKNIFNDCSIEELIEIAIDDKTYKSLIRDIQLTNYVYAYNYNGYPLNQYCKDNNLDYNHICYRIYNLRKKYPLYNIESIIKIALNDKEYFKIFKKKNYSRFSYYRDITLKRYCNINNINYSILFNIILKLAENNSNISDIEIIELALGLYFGDKKYNDKIMNKYQKQLLISLKNILQNEKHKKIKELTKS